MDEGYRNPYREFRPTRPPQTLALVVRDDLCTTCGDCADICPLDAIAIETSATIDGSRCGLCAACVTVCSQGAIDWSR